MGRNVRNCWRIGAWLKMIRISAFNFAEKGVLCVIESLLMKPSYDCVQSFQRFITGRLYSLEIGRKALHAYCDELNFTPCRS